MPDYRLSAAAADDLAEIADYSFEQFGIEQALQYGDQLEQCMQHLANNPLMGASAEFLAPELRRFEFRSHSIFYCPVADGVRIIRVLHRLMDVDRHI